MKQILLITVLLTALLCGGCASLERNAHRTVATIAIGTDLAVNSWYEYREAGFATVEQDQKVKALYLKYQASAKVAKDIQQGLSHGLNSEASYDQIVQSVASVANDLVALINSFNPKFKLKKV